MWPANSAFPAIFTTPKKTAAPPMVWRRDASAAALSPAGTALPAGILAAPDTVGEYRRPTRERRGVIGVPHGYRRVSVALTAMLPAPGTLLVSKCPPESTHLAALTGVAHPRPPPACHLYGCLLRFCRADACRGSAGRAALDASLVWLAGASCCPLLPSDGRGSMVGGEASLEGPC